MGGSASLWHGAAAAAIPKRSALAGELEAGIRRSALFYSPAVCASLEGLATKTARAATREACNAEINLETSGAVVVRNGGSDGSDRRQAAPADEIANAVKNGEVVDLTVTMADNYPAHWPFHPPFKRWTMNWFQEVPGPYGKSPAKAPAEPRIRSTATCSRVCSRTTASNM